MARLSILAISLGLVLLIATTTSAYRTTVTTVEIDSDSNQSGQSRQQCERQIQRQSLNNCHQYVREQARQQGGRDNTSEQQQREQCCQELRQIQDDQCQCQALEHILERQLRQGELRGQQVQRVAQQLQNMPQRCGSGSQRCRFEVSVSSYEAS